MPAKTYRDLLEVNKYLYKLGQKIVVGARTDYGDMIYIYFCDEDGDPIEQYDERRMDYYGISSSNHWEHEEETATAIPRFVEPKSDKPLFPWGIVSAKRMDKKYGKCHNAWVIDRSSVAKGYGPMLYDCMLVLLSQYGIGLTASRSHVSSLASSVWINYFENRNDIIKKPLDIDGTATPDDPNDDCTSEHENYTDWNPELKEPDPQDPDYDIKKQRKVKSLTAINHVYFNDNIATLNDLKKNRLFKNYGIQIDKGLDERIVKLYNSLIFESTNPK